MTCSFRTHRPPKPLRYVVVRTSTTQAAARTILRRVLSEVDPEQPMSADLTTSELVRRALSRERFQSGLLIPFGLGAALLAAIGVFGIVSEAANRRLPELTLRQALGATRRHVVSQLLRSTIAYVLAGEAMGLMLAVLIGNRLNLALFEVNLPTPGDHGRRLRPPARHRARRLHQADGVCSWA